MPTLLIVGGNTGIGLALAKLARSKGFDVTATCRSSNDDMRSVAGLEIIEGVDTTKSLEPMTKAIEGKTFDYVLANAGCFESDSVRDPELADKMRRSFEINTVGPIRVLQAVLPHLKKGSTFAVTTSRMGSLGDNTSGQRYAYRASKAAVNMAMVSASVDLKDDGILIGIFHPGMVATAMTGGNGISVEESAEGILGLFLKSNEERSGKFWHINGQELPW